MNGPLRALCALFLGSLASLALAGCGGGAARARPAQPAGAAAEPFRDVTAEAGIAYRLEPAKRPMRIVESTGSGCAFFDFDGDGHQDILLIGTPRCALYRSHGDGTFEDVTAAVGLEQDGTWMGCATGDYDNDGDPDLFLTGYRRCALFQNDGKGRFRDVSHAAGIPSLPWSTAAAFADFDRDGRLDLYVGAYADFGPHTKQYCRLTGTDLETSCRPFDYDPIIGKCFRGQPDGTFRDVTREWGMEDAHGRNLGVAVADFNQDGWPDVYLANDEIEADLYQNQGGKGFKNVAVTTGTAYGPDGALMGGMGVDWGDYDRDGWLDLLVGTYESENKPLFRNMEGAAFEAPAPVAHALSVTYPWVVWGSLLFDYDSDGWLDIMYVNGHVYDNVEQLVPTSRFRQPAGLFRNTGTGSFAPVVSTTLAAPAAARGLACADYDNDGDLDVLILDIDGPARLLRNDAPTGKHWLRVALRGTRSNRDGLGALVTVEYQGGKQTTEARTARSYFSACDPRVLFGLGSAERVTSLEVRWPSGAVSRLTDLPADREVTVTEGEEGAGA